MSLPKQAWGNTAGWTSATLIVVVIGVLLSVLHGTGAMTAPTALGRDAANYGPIALPLDANAVVPGLRSGAAGDAGQIYRDAADAFVDDPRAGRVYEDFAERATKPAAAGDLSLVQRLVDAVDGGSDAAVFADDYPKLIGYDRDLPRLEALFLLGRAAQRQAGLLAGRDGPGDADRSRELFEASLALGVRLYQERVIHREMQLGYRLVSQGLGGLVALARKAGDAARARVLSQQRDAFTDYVNKRLNPTWDAVGAIDDVSRSDDPADVHVGDVLSIARSESADPMWRGEAILRLGKYRLAATRAGDRAGAARNLEQLDGSLSDPRLKLAAERALALTEAERLNAR